MNRRKFLTASASAASLAALAGCSSASATTPAPALSKTKLQQGGWKQTDETQKTVFKKSYSGMTLTAKAHTLVYEDAELRKRLKKDTMGAVTSPLSVLFATRVDFSPDLDNLPIAKKKIVSKVRENAKSDFKDRLKKNGLKDVKETGSSTLTVNTGETAEVIEMEAVYAFDGMDFSMPNGETISVKGGDLTVEAFLATWHHGDFTLISGAAYPGENFTRSISKELTGAIDVSVDIDLGLTPKKYEQETTEIVKTVS